MPVAGLVGCALLLIGALAEEPAVHATLVSPVAILVFTAISTTSDTLETSSLLNHGPHGLTEILYAFTSAAGNNGSAFAGLSANTLWYNTTLGIAMLLGRFFLIIPMLVLAGNLARKKAVPPSAGTFPVTTPLLSTLLVSVVVIVGALTENISFAERLGANVVKLRSAKVVDALVEFARKEGVTHVIFGQTARSRWNLLLHGSIVNRFLNEVRDATVHVVPISRPDGNGESPGLPDDDVR